MKRFFVSVKTEGNQSLVLGHSLQAWRFCSFFSILLLFSLSSATASASVVISEFMAANDTILFDEDGEAEDWIELHNTGTSAVNLQNWYLTDDDGDLTAWQFPSVVLGADQYLVVFASNKDRAQSGSELHTNFKLKSGGEYLALTMPDGMSIASEYAPEYPEQFDDISYGGGSYFPFPTPGAANSNGVDSLEGEVGFDLAHGFYDTPQALVLTSNLPNGTIRYTLDGSEPPEEFGCDAPSDGKPWAYEYYEGTWTSLPDFDTLTAVATGTTDEVSTEVGLRNEDYALRFTGCVVAPADGFYTFSTTSDDGSQLHVDGNLVVDNTSAGGTASASTEVELEKGVYEVVVTYYQADGNHTLAAEWVAPLRGKTFSVTADDGNIYAADSSSSDYVEFEFDLPTDGVFNFAPLAQGPNGDSNSFWVQLDDGPLWLLELPVSANFSVVNLNNGGSPVTPSLTQGEHTLRFFPREDGARIDALNIIGVTCDGPCETQVIEAEIETVSGLFALAGRDAEAIPAQGWFTYNTPIQISQTSTVRAIAIQDDFFPSEIETQSYFFLDDVVTQSTNEENPPGWPAGNINGQDMDYGMDPDIVNPDPEAVKTSLLSLPSISIVTDIDNLMHPSMGIYVNAEEKGRAWERPASIELIDPQNAEPGFTIDAGVRIRGGFSRRDSNPKHPFRIYFRGSYDGDLDYPLFGDEGVDNFERMDLRSPNNYNWAFSGDGRNTFLREVWSRDTQAALGHAYTRSRYYHLFINGQYWGVNMTQERVTRQYAKSYFGGSKSDYDVVKHNRQDSFRYEASDGFNAAWNEIWDTVADETISSAEYAFLEQKVDIDNLIDYMLGNAYEGDLDGATSWFLRSGSNRWLRGNNWYAVRDREGNRLKWSFFQHDGEHTLGARPSSALNEVTINPHAPFNGVVNPFFEKDYMNPGWLHGALSNNSDYRQRFIDRVAEVFAENGPLTNEQGLERWLKRKAEVEPAILAHSARWGDSKRPNDPFTVNDWDTAVSSVENNVFTDRAEIVFNQLLNIGLASDLELPTLSIETETVVPAGTDVVVTPPANGTVYYTLDGSDPRAVGGTVSANAIPLSSDGLIKINADVTLTLRVFDNGEWSSIVIANYFVEDELCFPIKAKNGNVAVICL